MNGYSDCLTCGSFQRSIFCSEKASDISESLSSHLISLSFNKGQNIYTEGTPGKGVFCIQKGKIKIYKTCAGRNIVTDLGTDGDLIGYANIINGSCINSAKCLEDSQVCFIPKKVFMQLLLEKQALIMNVLKKSCYDNQHMQEFLTSLKCKNTEERIASALNILEKKIWSG